MEKQKTEQFTDGMASGDQALALIQEHIVGHLPRFTDEGVLKLVNAWIEGGVITTEDIIETSVPLEEEGMSEEKRFPSVRDLINAEFERRRANQR